MNKTIILLACLLLLSTAHKDKRQNPQLNSIYQPFTDVPKPDREDDPNIMIGVPGQKITNENGKSQQERQQEYEQFNEMLMYGLIVGSLILSIMLVKMCTTTGHRRQRKPNMTLATQNYSYRPYTNRPININELRNQIQMHKNQIKKLQHLVKQTEQVEKLASLERQKQKKRQDEALKVYYNTYQMSERIEPKNCYAQQLPQYVYYENIPMGKPLPRDNDSSFASEYPTI